MSLFRRIARGSNQIERSPLDSVSTTSPELAMKSRLWRLRVSRAFAQHPTAAEAKPSSRRFMSKNQPTAGSSHSLIPSWARLWALPTTLSCLVLVAVGLFPLSASASVSIFSFSATPSSTQAGAHPDVEFPFTVSNRQQYPTACACTDAKDVIVHLPTGLIGNPHSTPQCTIAQFSSNACPVDSQVGVVVVTVTPGPGRNVSFISPVYNLVPPPSQPALFAFPTFYSPPVFENVSARTESDYGIDVTVSSISHFAPLAGANQVNWGVVADSRHDWLRFGLGQESALIEEPVFCDSEGQPTDDITKIFNVCGDQAIGEFFGGPGHPVSDNSPEIPFFQNPTTCGETALNTSIDILAYDGALSHAESSYPATTACDQLSFNPSQAINPTTTAADSPSGAEFRLTVPQFESPTVPSPSELRAATVTLPPGYTLAPNVTNGKTTCSDAAARFGTREEAHCPENSKLGTISVDTPVLPGTLFGSVYLGEPRPGNRFRLFLAFDGFGVHVKLAGTAVPDPVTGQIRIYFKDLPQAPFESFNMHIFGSERGPLATPTQCGTYEVSSEWTPWDASLSNQTSRQFFTVDQGPDGRPCPNGPRPFAPGFQAASSSNTGGSHTSFSVNLTRSDGDQNLSGLAVQTPTGFSASLQGIPYCPQAALDQLGDPLHTGSAELASPLCAASQIGTVTAATGAGTHPLYLPGRVFLAGPYKGAPLSLEVVIPAVSGPYDLGNVAVRAAIHVDPLTAQITTTSDPVPQIFGGIPIRFRQLLIDLNRPGFVLNPTNCEPLSVSAALIGDEGAQANPRTHFQVANCAALPYAPKLTLKLTGGLHRLGHPAIHALLRTQPGEANSRAISLTLPSSELLDNAHIRTVCTKVDFARRSCPAGALLGHAVVTTPLLDRPLQGNAYLRSSGQGLPDLALDLDGQIHIEALAHIDAVDGGLRTTFQTVPDVPLGTVALDLLGGPKGLIQNSESLCGAQRKAAVTMRGQNGKSISTKAPLQATCAKAAKHKKHKRGGRH